MREEKGNVGVDDRGGTWARYCPAKMGVAYLHVRCLFPTAIGSSVVTPNRGSVLFRVPRPAARRVVSHLLSGRLAEMSGETAHWAVKRL